MLQNTASERAVLAGLCKYGADALIDISPIITSECFTNPLNQVIYKCVEHSLSENEGTDFASILASAKTLNLNEYLDKSDGLQHLDAILNTPIRLENVTGHAGTIRKLSITRELQTTTQEIFKKLEEVTGDEPLSEIISIAEQPIQDLAFTLAKDDDSNPQLLGEDIHEFLDSLKENPTEMAGISSGFIDYDIAIGGGFRPGCVDVVGARYKVGKSIFCDAVAVNVCKRGIPVLVLDTEMSKKDHDVRIVSSLSGVLQDDIITGQFSGDKEMKVRQAADELKAMPYHYINIAGKKIGDTLSIARRWIHRHVGFNDQDQVNDCLIIYDYFKLGDGDALGDHMKEYQALGFQMIKVHDFAVKYQVPFLTFAQLNKEGITKDTSDSIGGSDRIGQYATSISLLKTKSQEEIDSDGVGAGNRKLIVADARHGHGSDGDYVCMQLDGAIARLRSLGKRNTIVDGTDTTAALPEGSESNGETKSYGDCGASGS